MCNFVDKSITPRQFYHGPKDRIIGKIFGGLYIYKVGWFLWLFFTISIQWEGLFLKN